MSKNVIVLLMVLAFFCMYLPLGNVGRIFDVVGISVLCICAFVTAFSKPAKK